MENISTDIKTTLGKRDRKIEFTLYEVIIDGNVVTQNTDFQSAHAKIIKLKDNFADEITLRKTPINMVLNKDGNEATIHKKEVIKPKDENDAITHKKEVIKSKDETFDFKLKCSCFENELVYAISCKKGDLRLFEYPEKEFGETYYNENFGKLLNPQNSIKTYMFTERAFAEKITKLMKVAFPQFSVKSERDSAYVHKTRVEYKHVSYYIVYNERFAIHGFYVTPINICYGCAVISHNSMLLQK